MPEVEKPLTVEERLAAILKGPILPSDGIEELKKRVEANPNDPSVLEQLNIMERWQTVRRQGVSYVDLEPGKPH